MAEDYRGLRTGSYQLLNLPINEISSEKPVRENERRVRVGGNFKDAVKEMSRTTPMINEEVVKWVKDQRKEIENF